MVELAIIADDLTGALDAAAPFAMRGIGTAVALAPSALPQALATAARVVSVSTDSREIAPEAATRAVRAAVSMVPVGTPMFKKVDSRLKGNIAAELDAIPYGRSLVIPAIPAFERITRDRHIQGFGVPDPIDIAWRLGGHAQAAVIPEIETQADIDRALEHRHDLAIGARGLAEALAQKMAHAAVPPHIVLPSSAAYCIVGSTDPITVSQLDHLRRAFPGLTDIPAPNGVAPHACSHARLTLLQATPGPVPATGRAVAAALGASLLRLLPPSDALLVLSGGATAQVILETLGVDVLDLMGEVLPGMPIARAGGLTVVTKSGGFGEPDSLSRMLAPYFSVGSAVQSHVR
jgi:D-threonate/D-erythronate kinase